MRVGRYNPKITVQGALDAAAFVLLVAAISLTAGYFWARYQREHGVDVLLSDKQQLQCMKNGGCVLIDWNAFESWKEEMMERGAASCRSI
jgi:hypothetical protein